MVKVCKKESSGALYCGAKSKYNCFGQETSSFMEIEELYRILNYEISDFLLFRFALSLWLQLRRIKTMTRIILLINSSLSR